MPIWKFHMKKNPITAELLSNAIKEAFNNTDSLSDMIK